MIEMFSFTFIQNAFLASVLISLVAGIVGSLIVVNRMVFLSGGIAHAAYGGVGLAIFLGIPILLGASLFCIGCALLIAYLSLRNKENTDSFIGVMWSIGMAIGIILIDLTPGYQSDFMSYLFGSILSVSSEDINFIAILLAIIIGVVIYFYQDFLALSYDSDFAKLKGIWTTLFFVILLILASLAIVVSMRIVGLIMVIAMLTIPTYIAYLFAKSLAQMMFFASLFALIFSISGLIIAYYYNLTAGPTIILVSAFCFIITHILKTK